MASTGIILTILTLFISLLILGVSIWNLYLSHYKEERSEIDIMGEESDSPGFGGGSHAIDSSASWSGAARLKIINSGEKVGYIGSIEHTLKGLKDGDQVNSPEGTTIEVNETPPGWSGDEIEPHSSKRYRLSVRISPETDIGVLVDHDSAIIQHNLRIEDNIGSYEAVHETEMALNGPDGAIENWEEHQATEID